MSLDAARTIRANSKLILNRWEERARKEIASSYRVTTLTLQNSLYGHLEQLAAALESADEHSTDEIAQATREKHGFGKEHGHSRASSPRYSIDELILEYRIFRQVTLQTLEEKVSLSLKEREIVTDLIEQAVNDAAAEFAGTQRNLLNQFTATLTHDLRNPMSAVRSSAELIVRRSERADLCRANANRIIDFVDRIDSMIHTLLDVGRIRAGESLSVNITEGDAVEVVRGVIDEMTTVYGDRFALSSKQSEIQVHWSFDLFQRALENLLNNAVKYGYSHTPIKIGLESSDAWVKVVVHNEGEPIPVEQQAGLFKEYHRLDTPQTGVKKGWGLGLTLVAGVAQALHGTVELESAPGAGTSFILTLPKDARDRLQSQAA